MMLRETEHDYVNEDIAMNRMRSDGKTDFKSVLRFYPSLFIFTFFVKRAVR
ncbi:hypothetical protein ABID30_003371 [Enterococcus rotai]